MRIRGHIAVGCETMLQRADSPGRLDAVHTGHAHIHQHHVGLERLRQRHRFRAIARLADDRHVRLGTYHHRETGTNQLLIVGDDHTYALFSTHTLHLIGIVPISGVEATLNIP